METILSPSFILTNEHPQSSYGIPVLLDHGSGTVYGRADILEPYPSVGYVTAKMFVERFRKHHKFNPEENEFIDSF